MPSIGGEEQAVHCHQIMSSCTCTLLYKIYVPPCKKAHNLERDSSNRPRVFEAGFKAKFSSSVKGRGQQRPSGPLLVPVRSREEFAECVNVRSEAGEYLRQYFEPEVCIGNWPQRSLYDFLHTTGDLKLTAVN